MKQIRKRLTYANVMSSLAVFLVLGGATAFAATKIGSNEIKANAIITGKIKKEAVTEGKIKNGAVGNTRLADGSVSSTKLAPNAVGAGSLADGSVSTAKLANGAVTEAKLGNDAVTNGKIASNAVTEGKIANGSVSSAKLNPANRTEAFLVEGAAGSSAELPNPLVKTPLTLATLNLPAGNFVVTAQTQLIYTIGPPETIFSECFLNDDGTSIGEMADTYQPGLFFSAGGVSMSGVSDGGTVTLSCKSSGAKTFAFKEKIIATRVSVVN